MRYIALTPRTNPDPWAKRIRSGLSLATENSQEQRVSSVVTARFGSVSVCLICYRPGSVDVRLRFMRFLVGLGSVWSLEHPALMFAFFLAWEKQIQMASRKRFIARAFLGAWKLLILGKCKLKLLRSYWTLLGDAETLL